MAEILRLLMLYVDDLALWGESSEDLKKMIGHFVNVCERRCLKVYLDKTDDGAGMGGRIDN